MVGDTIPIDILKRGSRRSIGLHITKDGRLEVRAPRMVPMFLINRFVASKRDWIIKTKLAMRKRPPIVQTKYHEDAVFRLAGVSYTLHITDGNAIVILGSRIFFPKSFYSMQSHPWNSGAARMPKIFNCAIKSLCEGNACVI